MIWVQLHVFSLQRSITSAFIRRRGHPKFCTFVEKVFLYKAGLLLNIDIVVPFLKITILLMPHLFTEKLALLNALSCLPGLRATPHIERLAVCEFYTGNPWDFKGRVHIRKSKSDEKLNDQLVDHACEVILHMCCTSKSCYRSVIFCIMGVHWSVKVDILGTFAEIDAF